MQRLLSSAVTAAILLSAQGGIASATDQFVFQNVTPAPLADSSTFIVHGRKTAAGDCIYAYPQTRIPMNVARWEVRDLGIDLTNCTKLVEEGIPSVASPGTAATAILATVGPSSLLAPLTASSVASGYTSAWIEDVAGIHVTQDTTYISWSYSGTCVSGGSASGQWSWDSLFTLVSNGGTSSYNGCYYFLGDTWSTMKTISLPCPWTTVWTYYNHVRTFGWKDGSVTANRDDSFNTNGCPLPLWEHWTYAKTG